MSSKDTIKLLASVIVCLCAGLIGSLFTTPAIPSWYAALARPSFAPPNYLFAPVWTILYVLMGTAAFMVWRKGLEDKAVKTALVLFLAQLVLNVLWSVVFFGLKSLGGGVAVIIVLWVAILLTIVWFFRISRAAGWLLIPYILWVSFATALNIGFWMLS